jgi:ATP-dependent DNA helicase RecQ
MLIELVPPPADVAERMAAILERMARRNRRRLRALLAYLDTDRCRHAFIARHFGHDAATRCQRCDVCHPVELQELRPVAAARLDDPAEAVRRLVAQFPLGFGKPGVIEVLKGATARRLHAGRTELFGALAHVSKASIARTVDDLVARGELVVEQRDGYSMLRLAQTQEDGAY